MWITEGNKETLLSIIESRRKFDLIKINSEIEVKKYFLKYNLLFCWDELPTENSLALPSVICASNKEKDDFLPWATTYIPQFTPFSAFCRLVNNDELIQYFKTFKEKRRTLEVSNICVGLILGEFATNYNSSEILPPILMKTTFSYLFSQILIRNNYNDFFSDIISYSTRISTAFPNLRRNLSQDDLLFVWSIVAKLLKKDDIYSKQFYSKSEEENYYIISETLEEIKTFGGIPHFLINYFNDEFPMLQEIRLEYDTLSRENKMEIFERSIKNLLDNRVFGKNLNSFVAAYIASKIFPGSLMYINLLAPYTKELPTVILWYGLLSGLNEKSHVNDYQNGLGSWVLRELTQKNTLLTRPHCDISLNEFELLRLLNNIGVLRNLRTEDKNFIKLEVSALSEMFIELNSTYKLPTETVSKNNVSFNNLEVLSQKLKDMQNIVNKMKGNNTKIEGKKNKISK